MIGDKLLGDLPFAQFAKGGLLLRKGETGLIPIDPMQVEKVEFKGSKTEAKSKARPALQPRGREPSVFLWIVRVPRCVVAVMVYAKRISNI